MTIMGKGANKLKPGKRIKLQDDSNEYDLHVIADLLDDSQDDTVVFFAVTATHFGQSQSIVNLLDDMKRGFYRDNSSDLIRHAQNKGKAHKATQPLLERLATQYGNDKLGNVQAKVDEVAGVMKNNVNLALQNVENLESIEHKSDQLVDSSLAFQKSSNKAHKMMRWKYWKVTGIIIGILLVIIIIIILATTGGGDDDEKKE
jgi:hypothetical protein